MPIVEFLNKFFHGFFLHTKFSVKLIRRYDSAVQKIADITKRQFKFKYLIAIKNSKLIYRVSGHYTMVFVFFFNLYFYIFN
jgi:hypothetical protein